MNIKNLFVKSASFLCLYASCIGIANAAPVAPDQAMQEALKFLGKNNSSSFKTPAVMPLAYSAVDDELPLYYIFNHDNGFVITSADDRLPAILGYSDCGKFDINNIPDNFKWWLSEYSREIAGYLPTAPEVLPELSTRKSAPRAPIAPLTKTTWNQGEPYNNDCPLVNGQRSVTGCVATAVAQIMKFHKWPERPVGSNAGVSFSGTTYDWNNMIDSYEKGNYSSTQSAAVAKLMRQVGAAVNMQYSPYSSGAYDYDVQIALAKYFGYSPDLTFHWRDYTPMKEWIEIVYAELAEGRPVYYSGSSSEGGHAFVCDGYSENDYFHFNWGWGGYEDGYFLLSALNPASGGAGSYEGGYNSGQSIITGITPESSVAARNPTQSAFLANGGLYYNFLEKQFQIKGGGQGVNLMYNPLGYAQTLQFALEAVSTMTDKVVDYFDLGENTINSFYGFTAFTLDEMQPLPDGSYRLYIVYRKKGDDWSRVGIPLGMQNYVALSVTNGEYTFSNNGPDSDYMPHLIIDNPQLPSLFYAETPIAFHLPILNVGDGDFMGQIGITLTDKNNAFGDIGSYTETISVPAKSFLNLPVSITEGLAAGTYNISIMDNDGNEYAENISLVVSDKSLPYPATADNNFSDLTPYFYTSGTNTSIYYTVSNSSIEPKRYSITFEFLDANTLEHVRFFPYTYTVTAPGHSNVRLNIQPANFALTPGYYLYRVTDRNGTPLSPLYPLIVESSVQTSSSGLSYIITDSKAKEVVIVSPEEGPYTQFTYIPNTLFGYNVKGLRADAFAFFQGQTVNLDSAITRIPNGGFYCAKSLSTLKLTAPQMVTAMNQSFNAENSKNCWLKIDDSLVEQYVNNTVWQNFKYPSWKFNLSDITISSNTSTGYMKESDSVLYVNPTESYELILNSNTGKNIRYDIAINGKITISGVAASGKTIIEVPALGERASGVITAIPTDDAVSVEEIYDDLTSNTNLYSIDGQLLIINATENDLKDLPSGLYIYGKSKYLVP